MNQKVVFYTKKQDKIILSNRNSLSNARFLMSKMRVMQLIIIKDKVLQKSVPLIILPAKPNILILLL